ncbi:Gfo/Idh/MocA family oxidoreductase [Streptomyces sp. NPDC002476]|uniref:Gfo/Idh/MocA family oxidoreductase n=1 Tax=Streptomyces sp. NPDC002476 TaxID=3364648 RepID=UPI00367DD20D
MTTTAISGDQWTVLRGPISGEAVTTAARALAARHQLDCEHQEPGTLRLTAPESSRTLVTVRFRSVPPQAPRTLGFQVPPPAAVDILIDPHPDGIQIAAELHDAIAARVLPYTRSELDGIRAAMPLLEHYSRPHPAFEDWALLFRDHYLEHSTGFVLAMERAGIPAEWIFTLDKGDRTWNRDRVHATFLARGYRSDVLDNTAINDPEAHQDQLARVGADIDTFLDTAHAAGRRVLVVDDGGLLARGYGALGAPRTVDAALELTVSGIKRIATAGQLAIPVLNLARSQVKSRLGYREIADSCLRRLRALLPDRKIIGRQILLLGHGTLGSRLAAQLRNLGCRVDIVDTDLIALIDAAENGFTTYRTAGQALAASHPFLIIGTTGELALTDTDLAALPDGVLLAPFATRDFSALTEGTHRQDATEIPGVGLRFGLPGSRTVTVLGNGRSMNLFEADSIPSQGYDAYRAGTLIAATALCADPSRVPAGLHTAPADAAITDAGLWDAYYDLYAAPGATGQPAAKPAGPTDGGAQAVLRRAAIVGYGVAGRLHTEILTALGANPAVIDPKHQDLPASLRSFPHQVSDLPEAVAADIDLWSICCPTAEHLPVLRAVLAHNPAARVLMEKPACRGHEIDAFTRLLADHPAARIVVNDQYRHSTTLPAFTELIHALEPGAPLDKVSVVFTKDRRPDSASGRFIDRDYGVLGYEWLHMLAVTRGILPAPAWEHYLASDPATTTTEPVYDPRLFVAALTERTDLPRPGLRSGLRLELTSSILGPGQAEDIAPAPRPPWRQGLRAADDRYRHITVHAGRTRFTLHLEPVTAPGGWQLERNHHRITAVRDGAVLHDEVLADSPLQTSVRHAATLLFADTPPPAPDLAPLRRIARLAEILRERAPHDFGASSESRPSA